jgi:hypothetical protein
LCKFQDSKYLKCHLYGRCLSLQTKYLNTAVFFLTYKMQNASVDCNISLVFAIGYFYTKDYFGVILTWPGQVDFQQNKCFSGAGAFETVRGDRGTKFSGIHLLVVFGGPKAYNKMRDRFHISINKYKQRDTAFCCTNVFGLVRLVGSKSSVCIICEDLSPNFFQFGHN